MLKIKKDRNGNGGFYLEDAYGARIAEFDTLTETALVLRFLRGNHLSESEIREARGIMREYDKRAKAGTLAEGGKA